MLSRPIIDLRCGRERPVSPKRGRRVGGERERVKAASRGAGGPGDMKIDQQLECLTKGCVDVVRAGELRAKLERSARTAQPLTVKVGFDPTAPDLHLGHTVLIRKMKHFQDL